MASNPTWTCTLVDDTFGPWAGSDCRGSFDFTLLFEEAFLSILPLALILSVSPFRILYLWRKQTKLRKSKLLFLKIVSLNYTYPQVHIDLCVQIAWTVLLVFDIVHLVLWTHHKGSHNRAATPSAILSAVGAIILVTLSVFEHMRTIRPSLLLNVYLLFTVVFDIARSRSYSLTPELDTISTVFNTRVGVKLILAIIEARPKRRLLLPVFSNGPPESTSGPYKRALFWWLNALFKKGYSESLSVDDLFHLDKHLQSDYLHHLLGSSWGRRKCSRTVHVVYIH